MNLSKVRPIVSLLLIVLFTIVFISGIGLYIAPYGRVAIQTGWTFFGLNKWELEKIHTLSGFISIILVLVHFVINRKLFFAELKSISQK